jgi:hypothetical protein
MPAVAAVHEVQQRAKQKQKERQRAQCMGPVLRQQEERCDRQKAQ